MTAAQSLSPFAQAAPGLLELGWHPILLIDPGFISHAGRGKCPGVMQAGHWQAASGWQRYRDQRIDAFGLRLAMQAPGGNVGVVLGSPAGRDADGELVFTIAIDIDTECPDAFEDILAALPPHNMAVRGAKGVKIFLRARRDIKSRSFDDHRIERGSGQSRRLVDILTGFDTRQAVVSPSVHPDTGNAYAWVKGPVAPSDLVIFTDDDMAKLVETLQLHGYSPDAERGSRGPKREFVPADHDDNDPFDRAKAAAMANLSAWVPDLPNLYGLRPARDGFEAVAAWRDSSSGRPLHVRKRNLSIQRSAGIKDFGTEWTGSAIDLVMECVGCTESEALVWLEERLDLGDDGSVVIDLALPDNDADLPAPLRNLPPLMTTPPAMSGDTTEGAGLLPGGGGTVHEPARAPTHGARVVRTLDLAAWSSNHLVGEPPEMAWLVRDAIPAAVPGMVAAQGDAGKSMLLLDLARRIAFNSSPLEGPCFGGQVEREGTCVVLTAEDDAPAIHRRIANLDPSNARFSERGERLIVVPLPDAGGPMPFVTMGRKGPEATDAYKRLQDQLMAIRDLRLVVADPLQAFVLAPINEDPAAGQFICSQMATLAAETQATVLLAHHMRKADRKTPIKTLQDIRELVRGTSALVDGLRWVYGLVPADDAAAKEACQRLGVEYAPNRVIKGGVIKANGPVRRRMSTYVRNDVGLLVDQTMMLSEMPSDRQAQVKALAETVAVAARGGAPFTRFGQTGLDENRHRLPPSLQTLGRDRLRKLCDDALQRGHVVVCMAKGSSSVKWLDVPDGPFAQGIGEFMVGATADAPKKAA